MHRHLAFVLVPIALSAPALAQACEIEYPVRTPNGAPSATTYSEDARLSADGHWLVWVDDAADLVPGGSGPGYHVFLRDRQLDITEQLDVGPNGEQPNSSTLEVDMTSDARWIAMGSAASNLIPGDVSGAADIVLIDRQSNTREIVSRNDQGVQANGGCATPSLSPDGRFVAFMSSATNLDPLDTDPSADIFVRDLLLGTTRLASINANGVKGTGYTRDPRISADGRYVIFLSIRTDWFPEAGPTDIDVFRKDMQTGVIEIVSARPDGNPGDGDSGWYPWISANGRWVVFDSDASDLGPPNSGGTYDVYVRDMLLGATTLLTTDSNGQPANGDSFLVGITPDRSRVAFSSTSSGLVPGANGAFRHVYAKDLTTGVVTRVDQTVTGTPGNGSCYPIGAMSADGSTVAFISHSSNLVPGVNPAAQSLFLRECPPPAGTPLCFGDGTGTACPCNNSGAPGHGCANPVRPEGALLSAFGTPSVANDSLVLTGDSTTNSVVTYFQGTGVSNGIVFGDGLVCANGVVIRLGVRQAMSGASRYPGPGDIPVSVRGQVPAGGGVRYYQIWYRVAAPFCTPSTWSFSNAYRIDWTI